MQRRDVSGKHTGLMTVVQKTGAGSFNTTYTPVLFLSQIVTTGRLLRRTEPLVYH